MSFFPDRAYEDVSSFAEAYFNQLHAAQASVSRDALQRAADLLETAIAADRSIFACGNGGSAAIANHLLCDYLKGAATGTAIRPRVQTLSSDVELITAIANDIGVEEIFALPLRTLARPGDLLVVVSSSGASRNIVRVLETAREVGMTSIAMTGFDGGEAARLADVSLHVAADNYGVVEDVHQSLMHLLAQNLRLRHLSNAADLGQVRF